MGFIAYSVEEYSTAEAHFQYILDYFKDADVADVKPRRVVVLLSALNKLGILWSERGELEKAKNFLLKAKKCYTDYKVCYATMPPPPLLKLFVKIGEHTEKCRTDDKVCCCFGEWNELENLHTLTLYYLAQVASQLGGLHGIFCQN